VDIHITQDLQEDNVIYIYMYIYIYVYIYIYIYIAHDFQKDKGICAENDTSRHIYYTGFTER